MVFGNFDWIQGGIIRPPQFLKTLDSFYQVSQNQDV